MRTDSQHPIPNRGVGVASVAISLTLVWFGTGFSLADEPPRYPWAVGDVWTVRVERTVDGRTTVALPDNQSKAMESRLGVLTVWTWTVTETHEDGSAAVRMVLSEGRIENTAAGQRFVASTRPDQSTAEAPKTVRDELTRAASRTWTGLVEPSGAWRSITGEDDASPGRAPDSESSDKPTTAGLFAGLAALPQLPATDNPSGEPSSEQRTVTVTNEMITLRRTVTREGADEDETTADGIRRYAVQEVEIPRDAPSDEESTERAEAKSSPPPAAFSSVGSITFRPEADEVVSAEHRTAITRVVKRGVFVLTTQSTSETRLTATRQSASK